MGASGSVALGTLYVVIMIYLFIFNVITICIIDFDSLILSDTFSDPFVFNPTVESLLKGPTVTTFWSVVQCLTIQASTAAVGHSFNFIIAV